MKFNLTNQEFAKLVPEGSIESTIRRRNNDNACEITPGSQLQNLYQVWRILKGQSSATYSQVKAQVVALGFSVGADEVEQDMEIIGACGVDAIGALWDENGPFNLYYLYLSDRNKLKGASELAKAKALVDSQGSEASHGPAIPPVAEIAQREYPRTKAGLIQKADDLGIADVDESMTIAQIKKAIDDATAEHPNSPDPLSEARKLASREE